jgi:transposase-like protein
VVTKRRKYTASDRAKVFAELEINEGNIKRTARNTGFPVSTVRDWKVEWEKGGVDTDTVEALPEVIGDFVEEATRVRDKLLMRLEQKVDSGDITAREIVPALGMLTDKIRAYQGLNDVKHQHTVNLPQLDEIESKLAGALKQLVAAGNRRQHEIDEVLELEPSQYRELEPVTEA